MNFYKLGQMTLKVAVDTPADAAKRSVPSNPGLTGLNNSSGVRRAAPSKMAPRPMSSPNAAVLPPMQAGRIQTPTLPPANNTAPRLPQTTPATPRPAPIQQPQAPAQVQPAAQPPAPPQPTGNPNAPVALTDRWRQGAEGMIGDTAGGAWDLYSKAMEYAAIPAMPYFTYQAFSGAPAATGFLGNAWKGTRALGSGALRTATMGPNVGWGAVRGGLAGLGGLTVANAGVEGLEWLSNGGKWTQNQGDFNRSTTPTGFGDYLNKSYNAWWKPVRSIENMVTGIRDTERAKAIMAKQEAKLQRTASPAGKLKGLLTTLEYGPDMTPEAQRQMAKDWVAKYPNDATALAKYLK